MARFSQCSNRGYLGACHIFSNIVPYPSVVVSTKCLDTRGGMNMKLSSQPLDSMITMSSIS